MNPTWLYVGAAYAIAIALTRRARIDFPWRVAVLFYLLVLGFLFRPMTGAYVNVAPDVLQLIAPWSASAPPGFDKYAVSNFELQDVMFQIAPWAHQAREQWRALRIPLWNELSACGMPLLANMQSGVFAPLRLLTLPLPLAFAMTAEAAMKMLIALTFTFLYCRRRGYDVVPSVIGAISFGFGTFVIGWLHFPLASTAVWLPAVLHQIDLLAEKRTFGRFVFAAVLGPILLASGHPETVAHIVFFAALYVLWMTLVEDRHFLRTILLVGIVSVLLAAPILAPFLEAVPHTTRFEGRTDEGTPFSDFRSLALLVHPRLYGDHPGAPWGPAVTEAISGFAGILGVAAWLGLLVRAVAERRFREREMFFVIATAVVFLLIADVPVISAPFRALFSMALNARLRLLFSFLLAVQAAGFVNHVRTGRSACPPLVFAAITLGYVLIRSDFPNQDAQRFALVTLVPSAIVLAVAFLLPIRRARFVVVPVLAIAVLAELWMMSAKWNPVARGTDLFPRTAMVDALLSRRTNEPYRIAGLSPLFPNTQAVFGLEDIRVHDPMTSVRYLDVLRRRTKDFAADAYYQKLNDADSPLLDELNVRWMLTERGIDLDRARYRLVYDGADGRIFENTRVKPRFYSNDAFIRIAKARGDAYELHVDAQRPALILSSIAHWPGWRVTHNGRTLAPRTVNDAFLGFEVPAGHGVVRVRYAPLSFWGGVAVAILTLAAMCAYIIRARVEPGR